MNDECESLHRCARVSYFTSVVAFATFIYSFFIARNDSLIAFDVAMQNHHFNFVHLGRWYFACAAIAFLAMGLYSRRKASNKR